MIARRGVSLLRVVPDAEPKGFSERTLREPPLLTETMSKESGLDIVAIIQTFGRQDLASITGHCSAALVGSSLARTTSHSRWIEPSKDVPGIIPGGDLMMPLGVHYAKELDDILSSATNYLN